MRARVRVRVCAHARACRRAGVQACRRAGVQARRRAYIRGVLVARVSVASGVCSHARMHAVRCASRTCDPGLGDVGTLGQRRNAQRKVGRKRKGAAAFPVYLQLDCCLRAENAEELLRAGSTAVRIKPPFGTTRPHVPTPAYSPTPGRTRLPAHPHAHPHTRTHLGRLHVEEQCKLHLVGVLENVPLRRKHNLHAHAAAAVLPPGADYQGDPQPEHAEARHCTREGGRGRPHSSG